MLVKRVDISSVPLKDLTRFQRLYQYILVIGIMAISGFPLFLGKDAFLLYFGLCIAGLVLYRVKIENFFPFIGLFVLVVMAQLLYFGTMYISTAILQIMSLMTAIFCVSIVGSNFFPIFQKSMVFFAIVSLILFLPILFIPGFSQVLISKFPLRWELVAEVYDEEQVVYNLLFINFPPDFIYKVRNSGPFWEPAVYGGSLILAFGFTAMQKRTIFSKRGLIFLVAIITTFSTTTYLSLALFVAFFYTLKIPSIIVRVALILTFMVSFVVIYNKVDFLGDKINDEISEIQFDVQYQGGNSRMASAYLDFAEVLEKDFYILFGRGAHPENRLGTADKTVLRNNGITDLFARWGFPFFIIFFLVLRKSLQYACRYFQYPEYFSYFFLMVIFAISFSEVYYRFPFMWALATFCFAYKADEARDHVRSFQLQAS